MSLLEVNKYTIIVIIKDKKSSNILYNKSSITL